MKLMKTLVVIDLEATGTWIEKDKIIEIAMIKCLPNGSKEEYVTKVNPEIPIPAKVSELTGIKDRDVESAPKFKDIAAKVVEFIADAQMGGFNVERFDLPLLSRELSDVGISADFRNRVVYDAQKIYHVNEKRDLSAAYQFYCQKNLDNAHSALGDTLAALEILEQQVQRYGEGKNEIEALQDYDYSSTMEFYDEDRKFRWWNGNLYMMFGKYAKQNSLQEVAKRDPGYLEWIISADFSEDVKTLVSNALKGAFPKYDQKQMDLFG